MEPHVVILGCGFGGLFAVRALAGAPVLIDWAWAYWTFERNARIVIQNKKGA